MSNTVVRHGGVNYKYDSKFSRWCLFSKHEKQIFIEGNKYYMDKDKGRSVEEMKWLNEWKASHKKEVNAIKKKLNDKKIEITDENINNMILEPAIYKGMINYMGTGNPDTRNIIQIDHLSNWEFFLSIVNRGSRRNRHQLLSQLRAIMDKLPVKERKIIGMRYGLGDYDICKLREIAEILEKTTTETNNIINRIIKKMKRIHDKNEKKREKECRK